MSNYSLVLALCGIVALHTMARADILPPGRLIDTVICRTDPAQSYAIYIPGKGEKEALPVIYFFDPHGSGVLPLKKYRSLADSYGFILVGSNNSRNGNDWPTTGVIWQHLFNDTRDRWKIDPKRVYTAGFSGGAKVAGYVAMNYSFVKGVIANGAGLPDGTPAEDFSFSFTALAGEGDMNMTELVAITGELDRTRTRHRILLFDGKHEWAPESTMDRAFAGLQFDAMQSKLAPKDDAFITRYVVGSKTRVEGDLTAGRLLKAREECRFSINLLDGLSDQVAWFKEKDAALDHNPQFQKQRKEEDRLLVREQSIKTEYMQHFRPDEMQYWTETIHDLNARIRTGGVEKGMYQRLLAYLSLAFYSISNQLITSHHENAHYFVELYKLADPGNPEAWYFSAILNARERHRQAAESDLRRAVECGFRDKARLEQQPEFKELRFRP